MPTKTEAKTVTGETVDERIQRLVDEAPPLSDEVFATLRRILRPVVTQ